MTIKEIFNLAVKMGVENDLRGKKQVQEHLKEQKEKYQKLNKNKKEEFDKDKLENPYLDSRILNEANKTKQIKKILVGIDIDIGELLLAKELGNIDLVIGHHPRGKALVSIEDVMYLQAEVLENYGVPINVAEGLLNKRISEVSRGISPKNHYQVVDAAKLLNMPLMCLHTICDNLVANFLYRKVEKEKPKYVGDLMSSLKKIPEYKEAIQRGAGPRLFAGSEENRCGKIAITEITGGTEGSPKIYEKMAQAGVGTIVGMHMSEEHKKEAEAANINAVIAGHMSSDSIGVNIFLKELVKKGIEIIPCSGLIYK